MAFVRSPFDCFFFFHSLLIDGVLLTNPNLDSGIHRRIKQRCPICVAQTVPTMKEEAEEHQQQTLVSEEVMQSKSISLDTTIGSSSSSCSAKESNEIHSVYNGFSGYDREIQNG